MVEIIKYIKDKNLYMYMLEQDSIFMRKIFSFEKNIINYNFNYSTKFIKGLLILEIFYKFYPAKFTFVRNKKGITIKHQELGFSTRTFLNIDEWEEKTIDVRLFLENSTGISTCHKQLTLLLHNYDINYFYNYFSNINKIDIIEYAILNNGI